MATQKKMIWFGEGCGCSCKKIGSDCIKYGIRHDVTRKLNTTNLYLNYQKIRGDKRKVLQIIGDVRNNIMIMESWVNVIQEIEKLFKEGAMAVAIFFDVSSDNIEIPRLPIVWKETDQ